MRRGLFTIVAALGLALAAPGLAETASASPASDLEALSASAALVDASQGELAGLVSQGSPGPELVHDAGERLAAAGTALKQVLAGYQSAKPYGSQREADLIARTLQRLLEARAAFGTLVGARPKPPTAGAQTKLADQVLAGLGNDIALAVDEQLGVTGLTEALTTGGLRGARNAITTEVRTALKSELERQIKRLTGLGLALGVPLKEQLAIAAERALVRLLAKIAAKSTPAGILVELIGSRVIRFVGDALRKAFRGSGKLDSRTAKTLKGFENRLADLAAAGASGETSRVRRAVGQAERALGATGFLKDDLKRKRRTELLDSIAEKEADLRAAIFTAKEQFGIDSPLAAIDFGKAIDLVDRVVKEVNELNRASCPGRRGAQGGGCPVVPFAITSVSLPSAVVANGSRGNLYVYWKGNPAFPVTMVYGPDSCGANVNCVAPTITFTGPANPFVFIDAIWCAGHFQSDLFFDYSVYLQDANGLRTQKANADFTCEPF